MNTKYYDHFDRLLRLRTINIKLFAKQFTNSKQLIFHPLCALSLTARQKISTFLLTSKAFSFSLIIAIFLHMAAHKVSSSLEANDSDSVTTL